MNLRKILSGKTGKIFALLQRTNLFVVGYGSRVFTLGVARLYKFVTGAFDVSGALLSNGDSAMSRDPIIVTQQPFVNGRVSEVLRLVTSEILTKDEGHNGLFRGLSFFVRGKPILVDDVMDGALAKISDNLRDKARQVGANAVVSVRVQAVRGVESDGPRLIRISAVGTAVRLIGDDTRGGSHDA